VNGSAEQTCPMPVHLSGMYQSLGAMQAALFKRDWKRPDPDDASKLARLLCNSQELAPFQCWIVGSILTRPHQAKDIDVLFTRRDRRFLRVCDVERALVYTRLVGLQCLSVSVDPCFRNTIEDALAGNLHAHIDTTTWKLEDHILSLGIRIGYLKRVRRVGCYTVVQKRCASEANFFKKLPRQETGSSDFRLLPAGIPIESFQDETYFHERDTGYHAQN